MLKECANNLETELTLSSNECINHGFCYNLNTTDLDLLDRYYKNLGFSTELRFYPRETALKISGWAK